MIRPMPAPPIPPVFAEPTAPAPVVEEPVAASAPFIPPAPEKPEVRAHRMPRIEDLPLPAQKVLKAQAAGETPASASADERRGGLLQRLQSLGLGRKRDGEDAAPIEPPKAIQPIPPRPVAMPPESRRPVQPEPRLGGLDQPARGGATRPTDEEALEIPAFLRRQS